MEIPMDAIIKGISKRYNKIIFPKDRVLGSLKSQKATIILPPNFEELETTADIWMHIYEAALTQFGYSMVVTGDIVRLVQLPDVKNLPTPIYKDGIEINENSERVITQVITLKNVIDSDVSKLFYRVSQITPPIPLPDRRTLIITAPESALSSFLQVLELFDVKPPVHEIITYDLKRTTASNAKNQITSYMNVLFAQKLTTQDKGLRPFLLSEDRTNRLFVSALPEDHVIIKEMLDFLDASVDDKNLFLPIEIYRLKNSNAETVAKKLNEILKQTTRPAAQGAAKVELPNIVPFEELNALIISVEEKETYEAVISLIQKLDVKRNQIYLSSTIVEVNNSSSFRLGVEAGGKRDPEPGKFGGVAGTGFGMSSTVVDFTAATAAPVTRQPNLPGSGGVFALAYGSYDAIPVILQASESNDNINVLANQVIIADDNEKALIEINEERSTT
ncbi:MAG: hypothetical protein HQL31_12385, partial [Planctomycetes bacterium]|nr:hypothetical protein [Planctomycetota bacterium]